MNFLEFPKMDFFKMKMKIYFLLMKGKSGNYK